MSWLHRRADAAAAAALWLALWAGCAAGQPPDIPPDLPPALQAPARALLSRVKEAPGQAEPAGELAQYFHAHERLAAARIWYARASALEPGEPRWIYLDAVAAEEQGDDAAARAGYRRTLNLAPGLEPAAVRLARMQRLAGNVEAARGLLAATIAEHDSAAAHAELGQIALAAGQAQQAIEHLEAALRLQPQARTLYHPLAVAQRAAGRLEAARASIGKAGPGSPRLDDPWVDAMRQRSRSASFYLSQGLAAARSGDAQAALALMERAAAVDPDSSLVAVNLARAQELLGRLAEAEATLTDLLARHPDHAPAHLNLGVLDELAGDDPAALAHYQAAAALDPGLFQAQLLAAHAALRQGRFEAAALHYDLALALRPERDELRFRRVVALAHVDCNQAVADALDLVTRLPEDLEVLTLYIRVVATCPSASPRDRQNALNAGRNLHRLNSAWPVAETRAMAEAASGHFDTAADLQGQVIAQAAADDPIRQALAARLADYRAGRPASDPFATAPALTAPRRLTLDDRR